MLAARRDCVRLFHPPAAGPEGTVPAPLLRTHLSFQRNDRLYHNEAAVQQNSAAGQPTQTEKRIGSLPASYPSVCISSRRISPARPPLPLFSRRTRGNIDRRLRMPPARRQSCGLTDTTAPFPAAFPAFFSTQKKQLQDRAPPSAFSDRCAETCARLQPLFHNAALDGIAVFFI